VPLAALALWALRDDHGGWRHGFAASPSSKTIKNLIGGFKPFLFSIIYGIIWDKPSH